MSVSCVSDSKYRIKRLDDSSDTTLFDGIEPMASELPDEGVISNAQANELLDSLATIARDARAMTEAQPQDPIPGDLTREPMETREADHQTEPASGAPMSESTATATLPFVADRADTPSGRPMPELPPKGTIAALGSRKATPAIPKRIGSGKLVPVRLTWKPGDPFAGSAAARPSTFRWDTMLTAACIPAACGIGCLWILRSLLA